VSSVKALLFDLDGTLLDVNMLKFIPEYIRSLTPWIEGYIPKQEFADMLMASTGVMIANTDPQLTNEQVFFQDFCSRTQQPLELIRPVFEDYYQKGFPKLKKLARPNPHARTLLEAALNKGIKLVLATNPLFPEVAIRQRMCWGNLADIPFELVTYLENMHFCKPQPDYYMEILSRINLEPESCMMVGNDVGEDIFPAQKVGLKTFLVDGPLLINKTGRKPSPDGKGTLENLAKMIQVMKGNSDLP